MYVLLRKLTKYNTFNIEKNTQHNAICYYTILQLLHYFINQSITSDINIITIKYTITFPTTIKTYLLHVQQYHVQLLNTLHILLYTTLLYSLFHLLMLFP